MSLIKELRKNKLVKDLVFLENKQEFINTGTLALNVLYSGRLDGGIPKNKISMIAGISASSKSYQALKVIKGGQKQKMSIILIDSEFAYNPGFAESIGVDTKDENFIVIQENEIEKVQQILVSTLKDLSREDKENILIVIDSWAQFTTSKTREDAAKGKDTIDLTIAKKKNALARLLTGLYPATIFVVNQTYDSLDMYSVPKIGGGQGIFYASSSIVQATSKSQDKTSSGEIEGTIITMIAAKGRFVKEKVTKLKILIKYDGGINPFYGLLNDALEGGYIIKPNQGFYSRANIENDKKFREKEIYNKEFWLPILRDTDFSWYITKKYGFEETQLMDSEDFDITELKNNKIK
jgi:RecA/RadA recombinase